MGGMEWEWQSAAMLAAVPGRQRVPWKAGTMSRMGAKNKINKNYECWVLKKADLTDKLEKNCGGGGKRIFLSIKNKGIFLLTQCYYGENTDTFH